MTLTKERKLQTKEFKDAFANYAERLGIELDKSNIPDNQTLVGTENDPVNSYRHFFRFFSEFDIDDAEDKERLFALKLYIFEMEQVRNSMNSDDQKNAKTAVRKAANPVQALAALQLFKFSKDGKMSAKIYKDDDGNIIGVYVPFL